MKTLDLSGSWKLKRISTGDQMPCKIPGDNISALYKAGRIADPYFGENELAIQWIGREDWSFSCTFEAEKAITVMSNLFLELENIDTVFQLLLNGKPAGAGRNMFLRYRFPVSGLLHPGSNTLELIIKSPEKAAGEIKKKLPYPIPHSVYPVQSDGRNLIRKTQCHAGWDWGPCLMVSGIYAGPVIKASPLERIEAMQSDISPATDELDSWLIDITLELHASAAGETTILASCAGETEKMSVRLKPGHQQIKIRLKVNAPALWWPAGYGAQSLYELSVKTDNDELSRGVGFRKAEVITVPDNRGISMVFRINGKDIFCKGANWIPTDALPSRDSRERYTSLINSAVDANMNMLRVWGGGRYETDFFYELCDQAGLMIWQDFMFSCSTYPSDEDFLDNVRDEAEYQIKRLKFHPSVVLWCGNNEDIGALLWFSESKENRDRYLIDYDRLNEGVLGRTVKRLDPLRKWWSSSPSAGEGDYSDCWHDDTKGDMHYWSVWHEGRPFEAYREVIPRFCSEFGFQSFPSLETIRSYASADQLNITSPSMEHHQRNERGNSIIVSTLTRYFRFPESFEEIIYLSRVQQAMAIRTAVEYWRSNRPACMGVLFWQLNDTWPAASWSSIEYSGSWKPLHYSARRFFAPRLLILQEKDDAKLEISLCNDSFSRLRGRLLIEMYDFSGNILMSAKKSVDAGSEGVSILETLKIPDDQNLRASRFYSARLMPEGEGESVLENFLLLSEPKKCNIIPARVEAEYREDEASLVLSSPVPAFYTVLELPGFKGRFSDNNFTLLPGRPKEVKLLGEDIPAPETILAELEVHTLRSYNAHAR